MRSLLTLSRDIFHDAHTAFTNEEKTWHMMETHSDSPTGFLLALVARLTGDDLSSAAAGD